MPKKINTKIQGPSAVDIRHKTKGWLDRYVNGTLAASAKGGTPSDFRTQLQKYNEMISNIPDARDKSTYIELFKFVPKKGNLIEEILSGKSTDGDKREKLNFLDEFEYFMKRRYRESMPPLKIAIMCSIIRESPYDTKKIAYLRCIDFLSNKFPDTVNAEF